MADKIGASLSLMRRLPPSKTEQNLNGLLNLIPEETDELLQRVDQPLQEMTDPQSGRSFLLCDYNRDGDSYRSPWTNCYHPDIEDGFLPSESLRKMEIEFNELFDAYRELYYEGGVSSVYLWDLDHGFAGCFLVKKGVENDRYVKNGEWNSIHVVETIEGDNKSAATYKLTSTIILQMGVDNDSVGQTGLSGTLTRQTETTANISDTKTHISNIGRMIEDMEIDMRSNLYELYILKSRDVMDNLRSTKEGPTNDAAHIKKLNEVILTKGK